MKVRLQYLPVLSLLVCLGPVGKALATDTETRAYPVPEHGELELAVPADWEVTYVDQGGNKPPLITFFKRDRDKEEIFQLNISILWDDGFKRDLTAKETIRSIVEKSGRDLLPDSREEKLELQDITGHNGTGYYFSLTDAAPRPGEYCCLAQGAINVGNLVIIFSLFSHTAESPEIEQSLQMLKAARQDFQPHV